MRDIKKRILRRDVRKNRTKGPRSIFDDLERTLKILPVISVVVAAMGFLSIEDYYYRFGISIWRYLDISDLFFYFSNVLLEVIKGLIGFLVLLAMFIAYIQKFETKTGKALSIFILIGLLFFFMGSVLWIGTVFLSTSTLNLIQIVFIPLILFYVANYNGVGSMAGREMVYRMSFLFLFLFAIHIIYENKSQFNKVESGAPLAKVELWIENHSTAPLDTLYTDLNLRYIGSTRSFRFFRIYKPYTVKRHTASKNTSRIDSTNVNDTLTNFLPTRTPNIADTTYTEPPKDWVYEILNSILLKKSTARSVPNNLHGENLIIPQSIVKRLIIFKSDQECLDCNR